MLGLWEKKLLWKHNQPGVERLLVRKQVWGMNCKANAAFLRSGFARWPWLWSQLDLAPLRRRQFQWLRWGGWVRQKIGNGVFQIGQIQHLHSEFRDEGQMALVLCQNGGRNKRKVLTSILRSVHNWKHDLHKNGKNVWLLHVQPSIHDQTWSSETQCQSTFWKRNQVVTNGPQISAAWRCQYEFRRGTATTRRRFAFWKASCAVAVHSNVLCPPFMRSVKGRNTCAHIGKKTQ